MYRWTWFSLGSILVILILSRYAPDIASDPVFPRSFTSRADPSTVPLDRTGASFERNLADHEIHTYDIRLAENEFLSLDLNQIGVDIEAEVRNPAGLFLIRVDSANRRWGREIIRVVADQSGVYHIALRTLTGAGKYQLQSQAIRQATKIDRQWYEAGLHLSHAQWSGEGDRQRETSVRQHELAKARADYQALGAPERMVLAQIEIALARETEGRLPEALVEFKQALADLKSVPDERLHTYLLSACGRLALELGQPNESRLWAKEALSVAHASGNRFDEAVALNLLALERRRADELQRAIELNQQALSIWESLGEHREEATTLHNLGVIYLVLGREVSAEDSLVHAVLLRRKLKDEENLATSLTLLGQVYSRQGRSDAAIEALNEAEALQRLHKNELGEALTLERLAYANQKKKNYAEAESYFSAALDLYGHRDLTRATYTRAERGWLRYEAEFPGSEPDLKWALRSFRLLQEPTGQAFALLGLAKIEGAAGELEDAFGKARLALEIVESLRDKLSNSALQQAFLNGRRPYFEAPIELLMRLHERDPQAGFDRIAFEFSEMSRARALLDQLGGTDSRENKASAKANEELAKLSEKLIRKRFERWRLQSEKGGGSAQLEAEIRDLLLRYEALEGQVIGRSDEGGGLPRLRPLTLLEVQAELDEDSLLVQFFIGEERSYLWVVGQKQFRAFHLPPRSELAARASQLALLWASREQTRAGVQAKVVARELSQILLGEAAPTISGRQRLIIAADGALNYLPFAALPWPDNDLASPPLCKKFELVSIHSISVLALQRHTLANRKPVVGRLAVIANPLYHPANLSGRTPSATLGLSHEVQRSADAVGLGDLPNLPYSRLEAESLLSMVAPKDRCAFLGAAASRQNVLQGDLGRYQFIHFATHGLLDTRLPQLSGLFLSLFDAQGNAKDGFLAAYEVERLRLPVELVVLSACRTGLGEEIEGEGLVGLAQSFLSAGARRVAVSLWAVDDRSTSELMIAFYRGLLEERLTPAAALQRAQIEMFRRNPESPYSWAGFVLYGDWRGPNK